MQQPFGAVALGILALAFGAYSVWAMTQVGYWGIWQAGFANPGSSQITLDLIVSNGLLLGFLAGDCRVQQRTWWPWAMLTLVAGSFGTLAYLLWPRRRRVAGTHP